MKKRILNLITMTCVTLFSALASASVVSVNTLTYTCSNGLTYDVAIHSRAGWGDTESYVLAFCASGTLKQPYYDGRFLQLKNAHPDLQACAQEDTRETKKCLREFIIKTMN
jgi:hypothetical protein